MHVDRLAGNDSRMDNRRGVVPGVLPLAGRVLENRRAQFVVGVVVGATHALVNHVLKTQLGIPLHRHADLNKNGNDAGILTYRSMAHRTHPRINQNLGHGIFGGWVLLHLPGAVHRLHKIEGMIVGDKLQCVGDAINKILLSDHRHTVAIPVLSLSLMATATPAHSSPQDLPPAQQYSH